MRRCSTESRGCWRCSASLNIALFVFNMVPLLPLDGGHIAVALWDGINTRGRRSSIARRPSRSMRRSSVPITFVVVVALIVMGAVLILADIFNPMLLF